jgi:hypothetical protein
MAPAPQPSPVVDGGRRMLGPGLES